MNPLYNFGIHLFSAGARIASKRSEKIKKMLAGQKETISILTERRKEIAPEGFDVWFHAASLGEFEQARPVIERIRKHFPEKKLLLSFFSPSGYEVRKKYDQVDCVVYLPFDTTRKVKRFLNVAAPKMAIFAKYEFWGNYLEKLHRADIPTYIISAIFRPKQRFFKKWGGMFRKMLTFYNHLYVQDERSRELLENIGIDKITVAGDTRFDRVTDILASAKVIPAVDAFVKKSRFTVIAGSSWPEDEDIYIPWLKSHPEVKAIIAPHEFDNDRLAALRNRLGTSKTCMLSEVQNKELSSTEWDNIRYLIVDSFGLLSSIYRYGNVAVIGGGFGAGIHNLNEAAVYGIPVVFGPNHKKFKEAGELIARGGGFTFSSAPEFNATMNIFLGDPYALSNAGKAAGQYIKDSVGASDIIFKDLFVNDGSETLN